ncbi:MFS transporter, DHA1 family, bicyclomycin/chloramphenicol resistance protein [Celeribacter indicus]|nr:MFS transporter, DHA1 family, bicyclomycin/chloramphenicol resistance protein [Celeribacter indicus]
MPLHPSETAPSARAPAPLWLLALLTLSGTMAIHIFVPALPRVVDAFGTTAGGAQMTLSAYIVGLALAQIVYGPVADRYGRRPVLVAGMFIYALSGLVAFLSPTIELLIAARFFEAIGGGSGLVLGRAMVRDGNSHEAAAKKLSLMNLIVMTGPGISPLVGAGLSAVTGWRSIFLLLCLLGLANLLLVWRRLPRGPEAEGRDLRVVMGNYLRLLRSRGFLGYAIGGSFATTALYAYIGAAPFIFVDQLHRPEGEIAAYLAFNILGAWFGSLTANRLAGRIRTGRLMVTGNLISCLGALLFLLVVLTGGLGVALTVLLMLLFSYGAGIASPMALSEALNLNPAATGSASGLYGCMQMVIGALCAALSGIGGNPALSAALVLAAAGLLAQLSFLIAQRSPD